jgi:hypothetical protein
MSQRALTSYLEVHTCDVEFDSNEVKVVHHNLLDTMTRMGKVFEVTMTTGDTSEKLTADELHERIETIGQQGDSTSGWCIFPSDKDFTGKPWCSMKKDGSIYYNVWDEFPNITDGDVQHFVEVYPAGCRRGFTMEKHLPYTSSIIVVKGKVRYNITSFTFCANNHFNIAVTTAGGHHVYMPQ